MKRKGVTNKKPSTLPNNYKKTYELLKLAYKLYTAGMQQQMLALYIAAIFIAVWYFYGDIVAPLVDIAKIMFPIIYLIGLIITVYGAYMRKTISINSNYF